MENEFKNYQADLLMANYGYVKDCDYDIAVLPWGATEPHGYHLPYLTDCYLSHDIAADAVKRAYSEYGVKAMLLPPIPLGAQNPGQTSLKFCLHFHIATQRAVLCDIVTSLMRQGMNKLMIVNGHGGNGFKPLIRDLAADYPDFMIVLCDWFAMGQKMTDVLEMPGDHADELETSVMLHYRPAIVEMEQCGSGVTHSWQAESLKNGYGWLPRDWAKASIDTGTGDARKSTPEKGRVIAGRISEKIAILLRDITGNLPLM